MSAGVRAACRCEHDSPACEICGSLPIAAGDRAEILHYLGYAQGTAPRPLAKERIDAIVAEALPLLRPRGAYAVYQFDHHSAHSLRLAGITIRGNIGEFLCQAGRVAVFVVTAGEEISERMQAGAKRGDAFAAWVMDAVGSWAAESAVDALMLRVRRHLRAGEELTLRYSPGYCGMALSQQQKLFQLVRGEVVGVRLLPSMLMHPLKSISGLVGLASEEAVVRHRSPCDLCPKMDCPMRRKG